MKKIILIIIKLIFIFSAQALLSKPFKLLDSGNPELHHCEASSAPVFKNYKDSQNIPSFTIEADFEKINNKNILLEEMEEATSPGFFSYTQKNSNVEISIPVHIEARGGYRYDECENRPFKLFISSENKSYLDSISDQHPFKKMNKRMRVVTVCDQTDAGSHWERYDRRLLLKEYYLYKVLSLFKTTSFETQLINLKLRDVNTEKIIMNEFAFIREPKSKIAKRCGLKKEREDLYSIWDQDSQSMNWFYRNSENTKDMLYYPSVDMSSHFQVQLFNRLIRNDDLMVSEAHNMARLVKKSTGVVYLASYDFDMSGVVGGGPFEVNQTIQEDALEIPSWINERKEPHRIKLAQVKLMLSLNTKISNIIKNSHLDAQGKGEMNVWLRVITQALQQWLSDAPDSNADHT